MGPRRPLSAQGAAAGRHRRLWAAAVLGAWLAALVVLLRLVDAIDFGPASLPQTVVLRFAVETLLLTALAGTAVRTPPFGARPGLRGTVALGLWIGLVVLSDCLSRLPPEVLETFLAGLREALGGGGFAVAVLVYALALALPFVPGVEISLMIILLFGAAGAAAAYLATIAGLALAFAGGRLIPEKVLARLAGRLGIAPPGRSPESALGQLVADLRRGAGPCARALAALVEHRYLTLAVALNLPGNSILGGGGGIALLCGASRRFEWRWFVPTVALATAPIPALVIFGGLDVRRLVHLHDALQELFARLFGAG